MSDKTNVFAASPLEWQTLSRLLQRGAFTEGRLLVVPPSTAEALRAAGGTDPINLHSHDFGGEPNLQIDVCPEIGDSDCFEAGSSADDIRRMNDDGRLEGRLQTACAAFGIKL